ncbi:hypothetical protein ACFQS7_26225 [Dankookia sp. GCM10030260]|uniref:hypothetical protein n=1 Tax=Dankookia sp. GCM10030260 TaxID=3273390 RepID=UPI00360CDEAB
MLPGTHVSQVFLVESGRDDYVPGGAEFVSEALGRMLRQRGQIALPPSCRLPREDQVTQQDMPCDAEGSEVALSHGFWVVAPATRCSTERRTSYRNAISRYIQFQLQPEPCRLSLLEEAAARAVSPPAADAGGIMAEVDNSPAAAHPDSIVPVVRTDDRPVLLRRGIAAIANANGSATHVMQAGLPGVDVPRQDIPQVPGTPAARVALYAPIR